MGELVFGEYAFRQSAKSVHGVYCTGSMMKEGVIAGGAIRIVVTDVQSSFLDLNFYPLDQSLPDGLGARMIFFRNYELYRKPEDDMPLHVFLRAYNRRGAGKGTFSMQIESRQGFVRMRELDNQPPMEPGGELT